MPASSAHTPLLGSPQRLIDKVHHYYDALGQTVMTVGGHRRGLARMRFVGNLELLQPAVASELRGSIPTRRNRSRPRRTGGVPVSVSLRVPTAVNLNKQKPTIRNECG